MGWCRQRLCSQAREGGRGGGVPAGGEVQEEHTGSQWLWSQVLSAASSLLCRLSETSLSKLCQDKANISSLLSGPRPPRVREDTDFERWEGVWSRAGPLRRSPWIWWREIGQEEALSYGREKNLVTEPTFLLCFGC